MGARRDAILKSLQNPVCPLCNQRTSSKSGWHGECAKLYKLWTIFDFEGVHYEFSPNNIESIHTAVEAGTWRHSQPWDTYLHHTFIERGHEEIKHWIITYRANDLCIRLSQHLKELGK